MIGHGARTAVIVALVLAAAIGGAVAVYLVVGGSNDPEVAPPVARAEPFRIDFVRDPPPLATGPLQRGLASRIIDMTVGETVVQITIGRGTATGRAPRMS